MSIWLEMARTSRAKATPDMGPGTLGHRDRKDKTPQPTADAGVLSGTEGFCPKGRDIQQPSEHGVSEVLSVLSQCPEGGEEVSKGAGVLCRRQGFCPDPVSPYRPSAPGSMVRLDWSGEWVSRDRWDAMSDLERHGPQGRLFCGQCWRYRERDTALDCLDARPCQ